MSQGVLRAKRPAAILVCALVWAAVWAANASGAPPFVFHQTYDGVQVDSPGTFPGSPGGPVLHLGAFTSKTVIQPSGGVTQTTDIVLFVGEEECFEFSGGWLCQQVWGAFCTPPGPEALVLGPTPWRAALKGVFQCTRGDETTFPLNVDLVWSGTPSDMASAVFPWHPAGGPSGAIAGVTVMASVTGSVSDGAIEFLHADATGNIYHASDTQVHIP
jgi:hypothetical protein